MKKILLILFICYLSFCNGDIIRRKQVKHGRHRRHKQQQQPQHSYNAYDADSDYDNSYNEYNDNNDNDNDNIVSSSHVVVSKEGPPPSPQEYTISKLEKGVVCDERGDKTWSKWKEYDLDGVCSRLQYYGEIEGQCETDCDLLCPQGFYEVAKEKCKGIGGGGGYYRQCVGRYKCTQSSYDYWVNLKWWQFLIWEVVIVILGCCIFGLAVGCCMACFRGNTGNSNRGRGQQHRASAPPNQRGNNNQGGAYNNRNP